MEELLQSHYGFQIQSLVDGPRGFVGETYIVKTTGGTNYFVKKVKSSDMVGKIIAGLPLLNELRKKGISHINYPIPTTNGSLYILENNDIIVVFNYITGNWTFEFSIDHFITELARIHALSHRITTPIPEEDFIIPFIDQVEFYLDRALAQDQTTPFETRTHKLLKKYEDDITSHWRNFLQLADTCQGISFEKVITHGDAPGNVIVDSKNELYIVDWDEVKRAPAERDTWFHVDPIHKEEFLSLYHAYFPDYMPNEQLYQYYVYYRFFQDLYEFLKHIYDETSTKDKEVLVADLEKDCFNWLFPLMYYFLPDDRLETKGAKVDK